MVTDTAGTGNWQDNIVDSLDDMARILLDAKRVAVVGIKTPAQAGQPAFYVPQYLDNAGLEVIPVPVYYPDVEKILDQKVYRKVADIPDPVDVVVLFRRPGDIPAHVDDILGARPKVVWMQSGIRNDEAARQFAEAGIKVVQDRCIMIEHRRVRR